ncbi:MAG: hypothetical protein ACU85E_14310, partial [Gammaproteobacteria bacterium]
RGSAPVFTSSHSSVDIEETAHSSAPPYNSSTFTLHPWLGILPSIIDRNQFLAFSSLHQKALAFYLLSR